MAEQRLYKHLEELVYNNNPTIICNWATGLGRTYGVAQKIIKNRLSNVLYVSFDSKIDHLANKISVIVKDKDFPDRDNVFLRISKEYIIIEYRDNEHTKTQIFNAETLRSGDYVPDCFDLIIFDGVLPFNIGYKAKQMVSMISVNNYDKKLQRLYPMADIIEYDYRYGVEQGILDENTIKKIEDESYYYDKFAILDKPESKLINNNYNDRYHEVADTYIVTDRNKFLVQTLAKLYTEYDKIFPSEGTLSYRLTLLNMIFRIKKALES